MIVRDANRAIRLRDMCKAIELNRPHVKRRDTWLKAWGHGACYALDGQIYVFPYMHAKNCIILTQTAFFMAVMNTGIVEI